MQELKMFELLEIEGGASITGTFINAISNIYKTVADLGRRFGSAIRRISTNSMCSC